MLKIQPIRRACVADLSPFAQWLRVEMNERKLKSARQVAKYAGLSPDTVARALKGAQPDLETIFKLADYFRKGREYPMILAGYEPSPTHRDIAFPIMVPEVSSTASAGPGSHAEPERWPYNPKPGEREHHYVAVVVVGDCLIPRISPGERLIVDEDASPRHGDVVVVDHDGDTLVKVYERKNGHAVLTSHTRPPIDVDDRTRIVGVVKMVMHEP